MSDERDRLIRLEERFTHLDDKMEVANRKIDEMHTVLMKARGARWAVIITASIIGFILSTLAQVGQFLKLMFPVK
jgi:hypothetical protein